MGCQHPSAVKISPLPSADDYTPKARSPESHGEKATVAGGSDPVPKKQETILNTLVVHQRTEGRSNSFSFVRSEVDSPHRLSPSRMAEVRKRSVVLSVRDQESKPQPSVLPLLRAKKPDLLFEAKGRKSIDGLQSPKPQLNVGKIGPSQPEEADDSVQTGRRKRRVRATATAVLRGETGCDPAVMESQVARKLSRASSRKQTIKSGKSPEGSPGKSKRSMIPVSGDSVGSSIGKGATKCSLMPGGASPQIFRIRNIMPKPELKSMASLNPDLGFQTNQEFSGLPNLLATDAVREFLVEKLTNAKKYASVTSFHVKKLPRKPAIKLLEIYSPLKPEPQDLLEESMSDSHRRKDSENLIFDSSPKSHQKQTQAQDRGTPLLVKSHRHVPDEQDSENACELAKSKKSKTIRNLLQRSVGNSAAQSTFKFDDNQVSKHSDQPRKIRPKKTLQPVMCESLPDRCKDKKLLQRAKSAILKIEGKAESN